MSRHWWLALQVARRLWFRATLYAVIAAITAVLGIALGRFIPDSLSDVIGTKAVDAILTIIASSMLTVTTFSLSTLVSATSAAATSGTPRAISLLLQDRTAQSALSTFLGAFLFSLVGLIALNTGLYGGGGRVVLFAVTLAVVALIVVMLLRWIDHLAGLGQVSETIRRVADATEPPLTALAGRPYLGAVGWATPPDTATAVLADDAGFIRHLDIARLQAMAEALDLTFYVRVRPGDYCWLGQPIAYVDAPKGLGEPDEDNLGEIKQVFTIGPQRSYDQDPLFGLTVLSEIASRALSPGINDPGTANDVTVQAARLMTRLGQAFVERRRLEIEGAEEAADFKRVHLMPITTTELMEAAYLPIARDGAGMIEVVTTMLQALYGLTQVGDAELADCARRMGETVTARAREGLPHDMDRERLDAILEKLSGPELHPLR
ncbi:DUF2254 domain-containing protein [Rhizobium halophytocola]|uniref:Membrane protein n=1 Tax=Rhizobium halophytocola TaxID=735519 RepID=A0ABS4DWV4_9HYPH|nr:DUF2254 domain-containing protein [Rhizobium halophytocola]MBP1850162.1 putative membrane protein [Rhizobium halophytocola]